MPVIYLDSDSSDSTRPKSRQSNLNLAITALQIQTSTERVRSILSEHERTSTKSQEVLSKAKVAKVATDEALKSARSVLTSWSDSQQKFNASI